MQSLIPLLLLALAPSLSLTQYPPTPSGLTIVHSSVDAAVTISYKETEVCNQSPAAKSYSGFVHLPGSLLADVGGYNISTYFLYFEARHNPSTAPLAIYLAGGPGESSTYSALAGESGPCIVNYDGTDTTSNPYSFNNHVNMLYIDQPVQTGFSYDELVHATFNLATGGVITPLGANQSPPTVNATLGYGTYPSQDFDHTAKTTPEAARMLWHFAEHWLSSFPEYNTSSNKVSVWGNSYGGYWVPETAKQLSVGFKSLASSHVLKPKCLAIDTVGITNGCVDAETGAVGWPDFAYNNTYGVHFATEKQYKTALHNLNKPNGCLDLTQQCRALGEAGDPDFLGNNATVNKVCMAAWGYCAQKIIGGFPKMNKRDPFDVASIAVAQFGGPPCPYWLPVSTYLDTGSVQEDLGVPLNFTYDSNVVATNFGVFSPDPNYPITKQTGDAIRQNGLPNIEYLLDNNVKVAFVFGDRDFRCPWTGGEATALAAKWAHQNDFADAGYQLIQGVTKKGTDHGGLVKQYGQFSFSRIFDSGHAASAYAPDTVYQIFERTMFGKDVVTGQETIGAGYHTTGPTTSWQWRNQLPKTPPETCILIGEFSAKNPWSALLGGSS